MNIEAKEETVKLLCDETDIEIFTVEMITPGGSRMRLTEDNGWAYTDAKDVLWWMTTDMAEADSFCKMYEEIYAGHHRNGIGYVFLINDLD